MLVELTIRNLVILAEARFQPGPGWCVISGETGAGKSLILEALGLLVGRRARSDLVGPHGDHAHMSAVVRHPHLPALLANLGLEPQEQAVDEVVVRRRLSRQGRSQCWINDQPATLAALTTLLGDLITIYDQHSHIQLAQTSRQFELIDAMGAHQDLVLSYRHAYEQLLALEQRRDQLRHGSQDSLKELDYLRFQLAEFDQLDLQPGELARLEQQHRQLAEAETWQTQAFALSSAVLEGDHALRVAASAWSRQLADAPDDDLQQAANLCAQAADLLTEAGQCGLAAADRLQSDPAALQQVEERLASLDQLQRKHGKGEEALLTAWQDCQQRIAAIAGLDEELSGIDHAIAKALQQREQLGKQLAQARRCAADKLLIQVHQHLADLGMPRAQMTWQDGAIAPSAAAWQQQSLIVNTNPGIAAGPIGELASGGECARLMLALAAVGAHLTQPAVVIFDEIDSGVGGHVARAIGEKLTMISQSVGVIAITHSPHIAAMADCQYLVRKEQADGTTATTLTVLTGANRQRELAHMLGGGAAAAAQAQAMLEEAP